MESSISFDGYMESRSFSSDSSTSMSTPQSIRTASFHHGKTSDIQTALRSDFDGALYPDVPVQSFVEIVWGLDEGHSQKIINTVFKLREDSLLKYKQVLSPAQKFVEPDLHQPFCEMARKLLKDICDLLSIPHSALKTYFWDGKGTIQLRSDVESPIRYRKPDLLEVHIPLLREGSFLDPGDLPQSDSDPPPSPKWFEVRAAVEFKKKHLKKVTLPPIPEVSLATSCHPTSSTLKHNPRRRKHSKGSNINSVQPLEGATSKAILSITSSTPETSASAGSKRPSDASLSDIAPVAKKGRLEIRADELQLATYALESLFAGNRHYATGMLIEGVKITLWCYDRTGAICSEPIDITTAEGIASFGLTLFGLSQCNMKQAGFDPFLHRFIQSDLSQPISTSSVIALERPEGDMSKLCYKFPATTSTQELIFPIVKIISRYKGVNGRGTMALVVRQGTVGSVLSKRLYVLKLSWQYTTRKHEGAIVSKLCLSIPGWQDHLPEPVFYATLGAGDITLPRARIRKLLQEAGCPDEELELNDRELHAFVTNRFKNIWEAKSVTEFKRIFLDCLECHYHAWNTGKVLHRDISENNILIYQPGVTDRDTSDTASEGEESTLLPSLGILNDFDMAAELDVDGNVQLTAEPHHHITGTLPFMARDLLLRLDLSIIEEKMKQGIRPSDAAEAIMDEEVIQAKKADELRLPKYHLYRYDLESFLYILIWAATHYELDTGVRRRTPQFSQLVQWEDPDLDAVMAAKQKLFSSHAYLALLKRGSVIKQWSGLWDDWIKPLVSMFQDGFFAADAAGKAEDPDFDYESCGDRITFAKFMSTIGETPRGLNVAEA